MDPYLFGDDLFDDMEYTEADESSDYEHVYDTFDQIINEREFEEEDPPHHNSFETGAVFAIADLMKDEDRYDLTEDTDRENLRQVKRLSSRNLGHESGPNLRPFEAYVQDYIRRGFRHL